MVRCQRAGRGEPGGAGALRWDRATQATDGPCLPLFYSFAARCSIACPNAPWAALLAGPGVTPRRLYLGGWGPVRLR